MKYLALLLILFTLVLSGCAYFAPQRYVLPGEDGKFGTKDDVHVEGESQAQEAFNNIAPIAKSLGFGEFVAIGQAGLALITMGVGAMQRKPDSEQPIPA